MYDAWEIFPEHLTKLSLDFALDELLDDRYGVEGAVDIHVLQWFGLEYKRDTLLAGDDEDDVRIQLEVR